MYTAKLTLSSLQYGIAVQGLARNLDEGIDYDDTVNIPDILSVNYIHEAGENFTLTFEVLDENMLHVSYHLNNFDANDMWLKDIGITVELNKGSTNSSFFRVVGIDRGMNYKLVQKWLKQDITNVKKHTSNQEFLEYTFIVAYNLVCFYQDALIRRDKSDGTVTFTPVFGFKQELPRLPISYANDQCTAPHWNTQSFLHCNRVLYAPKFLSCVHVHLSYTRTRKQ